MRRAQAPWCVVYVLQGRRLWQAHPLVIAAPLDFTFYSVSQSASRVRQVPTLRRTQQNALLVPLVSGLPPPRLPAPCVRLERIPSVSWDACPVLLGCILSRVCHCVALVPPEPRPPGARRHAMSVHAKISLGDDVCDHFFCVVNCVHIVLWKVEGCDLLYVI